MHMGTTARQLSGVLRLDFTSYADTSDCIVSFLTFPHTEAHVRYDLASWLCMIRSRVLAMCNVISSLVHVR